MIPSMLGTFAVVNLAGESFPVALALVAYRTTLIARPNGGASDIINVARWSQTITYEGGPRLIEVAAAWNDLTPGAVAKDALRQIARATGVRALGPTVGGTLVEPVEFPMYPELVDQIETGPYLGLRASGRAACVRSLVSTETVSAFNEWVEPYFI